MARIGLYFYLNFSKKLQAFNVLDLGGNRSYTDEVRLRAEVDLFSKKYVKQFADYVEACSKKSNKPFAGMLLSGVSIELLKQFPKHWAPIHQLFLANKLQLISQPYYRSLNFLLSRERLEDEVQLMQKHNQQWLQTSSVFANTALIYNDFLAFWAHKEGFKLLIAPEGVVNASHSSVHQLYHPPHLPDLRILIEDQQLAAFCYTEAKNTAEIQHKITDRLQQGVVLGLGIDLLKICKTDRLPILMQALGKVQQQGIDIVSPEQLLSEPAAGGQLGVLETQTTFGLSPEEVWFKHEFQREAWLSLQSQPELLKAFPYLQEESYLRAIAPQQAGDQQHLKAYRHFRTILADLNLKKSTKSS